jgi:hypothetical protein
VTEVVSFRPTEEELDAIERTRVALGLASRAEAVRELLRLGAARGASLREDPVFRLRLKAKSRRRAGYTSRDIDRMLYGGGRG